MRKSWYPSSVTPRFEGVSTNQEMLAVTVSVTRSLPYLGSISHTHTEETKNKNEQHKILCDKANKQACSHTAMTYEFCLLLNKKMLTQFFQKSGTCQSRETLNA